MVTEDPRWTRSRSAQLAAITTLLDSGALPSVTDVVAEAGVSRPTFYQHFGDLPSAYAEAALERIQGEFDRFSAPDPEGELELDALLNVITALVAHLLEHRTFYCSILNESGARVVSDRVVEFIANRIIDISPLGAPIRADRDDEADDQITTLAAGIFWLISHWLLSDEPQTAERMAARIVAVLVALKPRRISD